MFISARTIAGYYVDYLWYEALGDSSTYWTLFWAKASLLLLFAGGFAIVAATNFVVADRIAPLYVPDPAGLAFVDRYRELVGARQKLGALGAAAMLGLMLGVPVMAEWRDWLLFRNYQSFGVADPQFNTDVGFYVFRLPFLSYVMTWAFAATAVLGLAVAAAYVANGSLRFQMHGAAAGPRRPHPSVADRGGARPRQGRRLLVAALLADHLHAWGRARRHLHRRRSAVAGDQPLDPRLPAGRRPVPRLPASRGLAPAGGRRGVVARRGGRGRCRVPGRDPALRRPAQRHHP